MIKNFFYRIRTLKHFLNFCTQQKMMFFILILANIGNVIVTCVEPHIYQQFIDNIIISKQIQLLRNIIFIYLILILGKALCDYIRVLCKNRITVKAATGIRMELFNKMFHESAMREKEQKVGDKKMIMLDDVEKMFTLVEDQSVTYVLAYITLFISGGMLLALEWRLALLAVFIIPVTLFIDYLISKKEKTVLESMRKNDQLTESWIYAAVGGWKEAKSLNLQKRQQKEFTTFLHNHAKLNAVWINYWVLRVMVIPRFKDEFVMRFGVYFIGGLFVAHDYITIGQLLVFISYYNILIKHLEIISTRDAELQSSMPYFDRVNALLETPVSDIKGQEVKKIQDIEFKNVSFTYKAGQNNVFTKLNHHIHEGECIEIAGKSGCGKSTFIKLLLGIEHQTEGQILISGQNIENFDKSSLWRRICCIMQDAVLFNTTIRENLLLVKPDATEEELVEVCTRARIMHDIEKMEDGMNTIIGERGTRLSRGQKQRIIIARSLLQDADLYVFDEATSGLDPQTESFIYQIVKEIGQKKTVLVITHSGNLAEICNRKIVLEQS